MYCNKCGALIYDEAVICPKCGCSTGKTVKSEDASSWGYALLGFLIPIVGLIMYLMWKTEYPLRAKSAGKGALISVIISVVVWLIYAILLGSLLGSMTNYY